MSASKPLLLALVIPAGDAPARQERLVGNAETIGGIVGGDLEAVPLGHDAVLYCNEEGKYMHLPVNGHATRMLAVSGTPLGIPGDFIAGNAVVFGRYDADGRNDGYEHDVPASVLDLVARAGVPFDPTPAT
jgi:hypothetical protein